MYIFLLKKNSFLHDADVGSAALFYIPFLLFYAPRCSFVLFFSCMLLLLSYAIIFSTSWHVFTQLLGAMVDFGFAHYEKRNFI